MTDHTTESPEVPLKRCNKCEKWFPATTENFTRKSRFKDGLYTWCKPCVSVYSLKYRTENLEKKRQSTRDANRKWRAAHPDAAREIHKKYCAENPEKIRAYNKKAALKYHEKYPDKRRLKNKKWAEKNPGKNAERALKWAAEHPEAARKNKVVSDNKRKARKNNLPSTFTQADWQRCLDYFNGCCAYCGRPQGLFRDTVLCMEHFIPLSSVDCPGTTLGNILPGCASCNGRKHDNPVGPWLAQKFGPKKAAAILARIAAYFEHVTQSSVRVT